MPFLLYVSLNMAIQAALELCFFEFFTAPEHAVWELAAVNAIEIPIFYRVYREDRIRGQADGQKTRSSGKTAAWKKQPPDKPADSGDPGWSVPGPRLQPVDWPNAITHPVSGL